jgi:energy-coupling factor transporter ATP-binding protein EcfA2
MQRRLNIAAGLLHRPRLLVLDEPTAGVDPQSRNAILGNVEALGGEGVAVLYTTHYMEEAERLCDRVGIVDQGRLVASDRAPGRHRPWHARRLHVALAIVPAPMRTFGHLFPQAWAMDAFIALIARNAGLAGILRQLAVLAAFAAALLALAAWRLRRTLVG